MIAPPAPRSRMSGRFVAQCPGCRSHRALGPDCAGGRISTRARRRVEATQWRRWIKRGEWA